MDLGYTFLASFQIISFWSSINGMRAAGKVIGARSGIKCMLRKNEPAITVI